MATQLCAVFVTVVIAAAVLAFSSAPATAATKAFSPSSFWYQKIPANAALHPNSAAYVNNFVDQYTNNYNGVTVNYNSYSVPIYTVPASTSTVNMEYWNCQGKSWISPLFLATLNNVPVPANAVGAAGTDGSIVIYQPSSDTVWEFWKFKQEGGVFKACWGGKITNASQNQGSFSDNLGVSAAGLSFMGGTITIDELRAGRIDHALMVHLVNTRQNAYTWPANRTDGYTNDPNVPKEGQRFRLDPTLNVDTLNVTPFAKMVARALQTYGMIVSDKAGAVSIEAEDPSPMIRDGHPDPYPGFFSNKPRYDVLDGMPWGSLQAMPDNFGMPGTNIEVTTPGAAPIAVPVDMTTKGYRTLDSDGTVSAFGSSADYGDAKGKISGKAITIASTKSGKGYWVASTAGNVVPFGDAGNFGSMAGKALNQPIVSMAVTPSGKGYWLLAKDGGVFCFGDAGFFGSTGAMKLNKPAVGLTPTADGRGYWFVASDGGIFSFGNAAFHGSMGASRLNRDVVGMTVSASGKGYRMVAADGGIFSFGDAAFFGSLGSNPPSTAVQSMQPTKSSNGYYMITQGGGVYTFGDAPYYGTPAVKSSIVAISF